MFSNTPNSMFPFMNFQMPQMPFPFQMPNVSMPFNPFNFFQMGANQPAAEEAPAEGEAEKAPQQMPFPFPNPFQMNTGKKPEGEEAAAEDEEKKTENPQGANPFAGFRMPDMGAQMQQFMDWCQKMNGMFGMNPQNFGCQCCNPFAGFQMPQMQQFADWCQKMNEAFAAKAQSFGCQGCNPFAGFQMPQMNLQLPELSEIADWLKALPEKLGAKHEANNLPFGMPSKLLQLILHMDSTPEGLSKFQKILDLIFDAYSKAYKAEEE